MLNSAGSAASDQLAAGAAAQPIEPKWLRRWMVMVIVMAMVMCDGNDENDDSDH